MKVLFGVYPWAFDCPGGGERQLLAWQSHLGKIGTKVELYNPWAPKIREFKIFHFFSVMPGSYQLCDYIKKQGLKLLISPNLWVTRETKDLYPHHEILSLLHLADGIVVNSDLEASSLSEVYDLHKKKFKVAYNGFEPEFLDYASSEEFYSEFPWLKSRNFVLNVGNVEPRKNQLRFLKALSSFQDVTLVNVGNVRDIDYAKCCRDLGREQFVELGELPYGSSLLRSALSAARGFVMPSMLETPSIAALEAAAYGKPILITGIGSTQEYFGEHAIYIEPTSLESISDGIKRLLLDDGCHAVVTQRAKRFTWESSAISLNNIYKDMLS